MANLARNQGAPSSSRSGPKRARSYGPKKPIRRTKTARPSMAGRIRQVNANAMRVNVPKITMPKFNMPNVTDLVPQLNLFRRVSNRIDEAASGKRK